jgi:RHS repeat-associated protein
MVNVYKYKGEIVEVTGYPAVSLLLASAAGAVVATYAYDAWGKILDIQEFSEYTIGRLNPIRYRGYYYDTETGYYYCQSRYYNPQWCRWISADVYFDTQDGILGTNMYAYCQGDPVNRYDPSGADYALTMKYVAIGGPIALAEPTPFGEVVFVLGLAGVSVSDTINTIGVDNITRVVTHVPDVARNVVSSAENLWQSYVSSTPPPGSNWDGGFNTFRQLKNYWKREIGLDKGNQLHHIVEQSQTKASRSDFPSRMVNNLDNVVSIPKDVHKAISSYYSSIDRAVSGNMTVRDWLTGQSFEFQHEFGLDILDKALKGLL